ncbi:MAG: hypothetical protein GYA43_02230 [Bacteroidales bacterium]|nr:hypothetical protein [Bacteroidales bacterium]
MGLIVFMAAHAIQLVPILGTQTVLLAQTLPCAANKLFAFSQNVLRPMEIHGF